VIASELTGPKPVSRLSLDHHITAIAVTPDGLHAAVGRVAISGGKKRLPMVQDRRAGIAAQRAGIGSAPWPQTRCGPQVTGIPDEPHRWHWEQGYTGTTAEDEECRPRTTRAG
jgi:hypothetical protein